MWCFLLTRSAADLYMDTAIKRIRGLHAVLDANQAGAYGIYKYDVSNLAFLEKHTGVSWYSNFSRDQLVMTTSVMVFHGMRILRSPEETALGRCLIYGSVRRIVVVGESHYCVWERDANDMCSKHKRNFVPALDNFCYLGGSVGAVIRKWQRDTKQA